MNYWQTFKDRRTLWYTLAWVLFGYLGRGISPGFVESLYHRNYSGALGSLTAELLFFVGFYFIVGTIRFVYKKLVVPPQK